MTDRSELEQDIMTCWHTADDIQLLYENVMNTEMSRDDIANALIGIAALAEMRSSKCFSTFEKLIHEKKL